MKILYVNAPMYDYLTASLIEGLDALGHEVITTQNANRGRVAADAEVRDIAESADLIVVGSNAGVRTHLVQDVKNPRKVFVDGADQQEFTVTNNIRYKLVFKRELSRALRDPQAQFLFPLPFAAEERYFTDETVPRDLQVTFLANMHTNPLRHSIHQRLKNLQSPAIVSGTTNERAYSTAQPKATAIETPLYRQLLRRSQISVSVAGAGYDTARFWEILAAGAMLFTQEPDIVIPHGFTDGVDCVTFASIREFEEKLMFYLNRPELVKTIAARGQARVKAHHTTKARATQFLEAVETHIARDGYCAQFLHPEIRAIEEVCVGRGLDVGCGSSKTTPNCIGVDLTPAGAAGSVGCENGRVSVAEIAASGDALTMFADGTLDFVVARHNLEHYHDPEKTLREWKRVLRPGGRIGVVVPDHEKVDTYALDPTHYCHFTRDSLGALVTGIGGLRVHKLDVCVPNWSLVAIVEKEAA